MEMLLKAVVLLLVTCVQQTWQLKCGSDELATDDPCDCNQPIFIIINDTVTPGTTFASFNSSLELTPCPGFNLTDNQFILLQNLREPCIAGIDCDIRCGQDVKTVRIRVTQVDDHPPVFPNETFTTEIFEDIGVGTTVFDFSKPENKPEDEDCPEEKSMNFFVPEGSTGSDIFGIPNRSLGQLMLTKTVDYEKVQTYNLTVGVTSSVQGRPGKTGYTTLIIQIQDADDNDPAFDHLEYNLNVTEETVSSTLITALPPVRGYDKDKGINQTIFYSFQGYLNVSDFLRINRDDGAFTVTKAVDRENTSSYEFTIWCFQSDKHEKRASATLFVNVLDVNDNPAIFSPEQYNVTLVENAVGYVTTVMATDKDIGDNAVIFYEIINVTSPFDINADTGDVRVKTPADLDREKTPVLHILARAKDRDGNYSINTATITVTLLDINDNSPEFEEDLYVFHINSTKDGDTVGQVHARDSDEDGSPNANVTYSLYLASITEPFIIGELDGGLAIKGQFDVDIEYSFLVQACDNPVEENDRRCSIVSVVVMFGGNDTFVTYDLSMEVHENVPVGTIFGTIIPVAGDQYVCSTGDFDVDMQSTMMRTRMDLDREMNDTFTFYIEVFRYTEPRGNISVTVTVLDVNDNVPTFTQDEYYLCLPDTITKHTEIGTVMATDEDTAENANLSYSFQHTSSGLFTIDTNKGNISTSEQWTDNTMYKQSLYHLIVVATDHGEPPLMSVAPIYVSSMRIDSESAVGIPTPRVKINDVKPLIERGLADLLGYDSMTVTEIDESSSRIFVKAYTNNTEVEVTDLQRSLIQNWSPVQDLFRQYMTPVTAALEHSDPGLSTAEIALITISVAVFFGGLISIIIICRQWDIHVKNHRLYDTLRRPSNMYDSQELRINFAEEELPSRFSTFKGPRRTEHGNLEGSFGLGYVNAAFNSDGDEINAPTTPTWSCNDTPRVPRWSTSDSLKDAIESLDELTNRLNSEDNISRVSNMSRAISNRSEPVTPRADANEHNKPSGKGVSQKYEDLVIRQVAQDTEIKKMNQKNIQEDEYDSGISEAERIQDIIESNREIAEYENTSRITGDIVSEESTAF